MQWCIAKNGGGYTQRGVAKGLKVHCLFVITEVSIHCQKNPEVGIRRIPPNTPLETWVFCLCAPVWRYSPIAIICHYLITFLCLGIPSPGQLVCFIICSEVSYPAVPSTRDVKTVYFSEPVTGLPKPVFYQLPKGLL